MSSRFEDNIAWQKARILTRDIYRITRDNAFSRDFGLSSQIQRACVSIMSNIAEGFERNNPGDYYRFLQFAKASCGEVRCQLYIALDVNYIQQSEFDELYENVVEISRIISGIMKAVDKRR